MSSTTKLTIAFFGATGGVTSTVLILALQSSAYTCHALVRTPQKLRTLLLSRGVTDSQLSNLTIKQGNANNVDSVRTTIQPGGPGTPLVDIVVTGLGAAPQLCWPSWSTPLCFTIDQPNLCHEAAGTLVQAVRDAQSEADQPSSTTKKPRVAFISTTGISKPHGPDDVPFWMRFLYHQVLHIPHVDKRKMEDLFRADRDRSTTLERLFSSITGVRPTLLTDGEPVGQDKIRVGTEKSPEMGYTISRRDVGTWVFENVVQNGGTEKFRDDFASLTS